MPRNEWLISRIDMTMTYTDEAATNDKTTDAKALKYTKDKTTSTWIRHKNDIIRKSVTKHNQNIGNLYVRTLVPEHNKYENIRDCNRL